MNKIRFACITYHLIGRWRTPYAINESQLTAQLSTLKTGAYVVEGFRELEWRLRAGAGTPEAHYVVLTVDDGHESCILAADLFQQYGFRATFFLTRDRSVGAAGYIRGPVIRELYERGFSLGTHGTTHRGLTFLTENACIAELRESKKWLEDLVGEEIRYTAAPGGFINKRVLRLIGEEGYVLTGTCKEAMNSPVRMVLPDSVCRVNVRRDYGAEVFSKIISGHKMFFAGRRIRAGALAIPKRAAYLWSQR